MLINGSKVEFNGTDIDKIIEELKSLPSGFQQKNNSLNPKAYRVEEGEYGFSCDQLIGTDNVNNCICLIIQNPKTKKTALAHISTDTQVDSLPQIIDSLIFQNTTLKARIVGARFDNTSSLYLKREKELLIKLIESLNDQNIDIISVDLFNPKQPRSVIVDPKTFELTDEIASVSNPNAPIRIGKILLDASALLELSIDLTSSTERLPILLTFEEIKTLRAQFINKTESEIFEWFKINRDFCNDQISKIVEYIVTLNEEYQKALKHIYSVIDNQIKKYDSTRILINDMDLSYLKQTILKKELYIGFGSEKANQSLIDFIENKLFSTIPASTSGIIFFSDDIKLLKVNLIGLQKFKFTEKSYFPIKNKSEKIPTVN